MCVDKTHPCPEFSFCILHTNLAELERVGMQFRSNSMEQVYFCTLDLLVQCNSTHQTIEKLSHDFLRHFSTLYIEISLCETWRKYVLVCDRNHVWASGTETNIKYRYRFLVHTNIFFETLILLIMHFMNMHPLHLLSFHL